MPDLYDLLQVSRNSTTHQIHSAYRRLAMTCHPDRFAGDEVKAKQFKIISVADAILCDRDKRAAHDRGDIWWNPKTQIIEERSRSHRPPESGILWPGYDEIFNPRMAMKAYSTSLAMYAAGMASWTQLMGLPVASGVWTAAAESFHNQSR